MTDTETIKQLREDNAKLAAQVARMSGHDTVYLLRARGKAGHKIHRIRRYVLQEADVTELNKKWAWVEYWLVNFENQTIALVTRAEPRTPNPEPL